MVLTCFKYVEIMLFVFSSPSIPMQESPPKWPKLVGRADAIRSIRYILSIFVNKLVYGLEPNATGSLDPARVESLLAALQSIGAGSPSLPHQASYDLILATLVAYFRRHLLSTPAPSCPSSQEILASLLTAKALGRGQGRRHSLRHSILGLLCRHPKLRGRICSVCRGGSVAMALDTTSSDHDIILCLKDGGGRSYGQCHFVIWFSGVLCVCVTVGCLLQLMFVLGFRFGQHLVSTRSANGWCWKGAFQVARKMLSADSKIRGE